jgi:hypothetical protein
MTLIIEILEGLFFNLVDHYLFNSFVFSIGISIVYPIAKRFIGSLLSTKSLNNSVLHGSTYKSNNISSRTILIIAGAVSLFFGGYVYILMSNMEAELIFTISLEFGLMFLIILTSKRWGGSKLWASRISVLGGLLLITSTAGLAIFKNVLPLTNGAFLGLQIIIGASILTFGLAGFQKINIR